MGITAENVAKEYGISREMQDELALQSQRKAVAAIESGAFEAEIVPVSVSSRKKTIIVERDEFPKLTRRQKASPHCVQPLIKQEPSPQVTPRGSTTVQRH